MQCVTDEVLFDLNEMFVSSCDRCTDFIFIFFSLFQIKLAENALSFPSSSLLYS